MGRLKENLKHAFHVEESGPAEPTDQQKPKIDKLCYEVARRRLTTPALMALQMSRPLNYLGAQAMHFFEPIVWALFDTEGYKQVAAFLEQRGSIDYLCNRIEYYEKEFESKEKKRKQNKTSGDGAEQETDSE